MTIVVGPWFDESHEFSTDWWNKLVQEQLAEVGYKLSGVSNGDLYMFGAKIRSEKVKLKVTLSRELTLSERELFRVEFIELPSGDVTHKFQEPHVLILESEGDPLWSRQLAWDLHEFLASEFFNVHIRAVHTLSPKVVV